MTDILTIGTRSLMNVQHALTTTGHNIANANTDGYSRQQIKMDAGVYRGFGFGYVGQGAQVASIDRVFDRFVANQLNGFVSSTARYETSVQLNNRLNDLFADPQSSLNSSIQNLFSAVQEVSTNPSGMAQREVMLGEAQNLVYRQQSLNKLLVDMGQDVNNQIRLSVDELNNLVSSIGKLNQQIVSATTMAFGAQPNDLLDERDRLIRSLSEKVAVTVEPQQDGGMNLFIGNGQGLVIGNQTMRLEVRNNAYDASRIEIALEGQKAGENISRFINGGELQGLMEFRNRNLLQAQDALGLIALTLTESFNAQHQLGLDMNGVAGGAFFSHATALVRPHTTNGGNAEPAVTVTDASQVRASDYRLFYTGSEWQLTRLSDDTSVSGPGPLSLDGMTVDVSSGTPNTYDSFVFNPARDAGSTFKLAIADARSIAAASVLTLGKPATNTGTGNIATLGVTNPAMIPLPAEVTLSFDPDALGPGQPGLLVNGGADGVLAYDPVADSAGKSFTLDALGVSFTLNGAPAAGDSFTLQNNSGARGDNGNAIQLGALQTMKQVNGGLSTLQQHYGDLISRIGIAGRQAETALVVEQALYQQAENYHLSITGVNLDEEAANLIRYQQSYQASAQVVRVATETFQILLDSIG
jgi:flagellar hook-associated protein 1 FlgK